jgi:hypothetical protein
MAINIAGQTITGNTPPFDSPQTKVGRISFDATAITAADSVVVSLGFTPKYIAWENVTDRTKIEWYEGMAANSCIKTAAAGTRTLEVTGGNGGITVCNADGTTNVDGKSFSVLQNATLAAILASKVCTWIAKG